MHEPGKLIPLHGGYRRLKSFQVAQLGYDVTVRFCDRYIEKRSRTHDRMVQAARSGVQNIAEGSIASGTSKKTELKLTNVARASPEELRLDYEDFLRQRGLEEWAPEHPATSAWAWCGIHKARRRGRSARIETGIGRLHGKWRHGRDSDWPGKLLNNEIRIRSKKFLVQSKSFAEMLEESIRKYQNRAIEAAAVIEELILLAREMREAGKRGEELKLTKDELPFYDALEVNDSAVKVPGEPTLCMIAHELVQTIRDSVTIGWTEREAVRAKIRVAVKRILRKHGYPPDKQEKATQTVLQQAELLCGDWAG